MLTHLDEKGRPAMVNVGPKPVTHRTATAVAVVSLPPELAALLKHGEIQTKKGPVFHAAVLAGVMGAKRTSELIPLCHPLPLSKIEVRIEIDDALPGFRVSAEVRTTAVTGVEMEALTAVSVACLTLFDMLKAIDRAIAIGGIEVTSKTGGKSGDWQRT